MAAQDIAGTSVARLLRVFADEAGETHLEEIPMGPVLGDVPVKSVEILNYDRRSADWHNAPDRRFALNVVGELEVKTSDGKIHPLWPGDLVYIEDVTGKGHVTMPLTPIIVIFIHVEDDFDVVAWAKNQGQ